MLKLKSDTFESMDFCYDLVDLFNKDGLFYIFVLLQNTKKIQKIHSMCNNNSNIDTSNILNNLLDNLIDFTISNLSIETIHSTHKDYNNILASIRKQNIEYVGMIIDKEDFEMFFHLKEKRSQKLISALLSEFPEIIENQFNQNPETDDE